VTAPGAGPAPEPIRSALAGRYELDQPIGQGGMATVYRARDVRHGRVVAVKVLRPDLSATLGAERFLREIGIAARLHHPHILLLIDSGEVAGQLYYVMPFVNGESLRGRLLRAEPITPAQVVRTVSEVADALDYAHRQGIVHRDIKPENILLAEGHAVVADFGVAKAVTAAAADRLLTRTGYPVGTVGYMSPEQAAGSADLDARSDGFSLACVAYEMLVGAVPGLWPGEESTRLLRFLDAPPAHRERLDRLPGTVEQVLVRAMHLEPDRRFGGPRQFAEALAQSFGERPRFSDGQVKAIVARAAEIEAAAPTASGALSLGGIQQLAADVGIRPEHVAAAAREVTRPPAAPSPWWRLAGAPTRLVQERVVPGEIAEADYPAVVDEIRAAVGTVGMVSTLGRSLAWNSLGVQGGVGRLVQVTVTPRHGETRIQVEENLTPVAGGLFGGIMAGGAGPGVPGAVALGVEVLHSAAAAALLAAGVVLGAFSLARTLFRRTERRRRAQLADLLDRVTELVRSGGQRLLG
jgi:tRNA A-37 threonylcarbamoyl transferase component Bud32